MKRFLQFSILYLLLLLISGVVAMGQNYFWDTFDNPPNLTNWVVDRYEPEKFEKAFFDGDNRLHLEINVNDASAGRPGGQQGTFYNTQGRKITVNNDYPVVIQGSLYIASDWNTTHRRSDIWGGNVTSSGGNPVEYPIIGFANVDGTSPTFRVYDANTTGWVNVSATINYGSWNKFFILLTTSGHQYYINGTLVYTDNTTNSTVKLKEIIVQGYNFGDPTLPVSQQAYETYDIYWDDIATYPYNTSIVFNLTQGTNYTTIQSAVNAANANDHLLAMPGTYSEKVVLNKSLILDGYDEATVILDGTALGNGSGIYINNGIQNVIIRYLTVQNFSGTSPNSYGGIYAVGGNDNITIKNCTIKNNVGCSGFYANGPIDNVLLDDVTASGHPNTFGAARGIVIWNGLKSNITIKNCEVFNNNCCGIELQDGTASGVTLLNNNIYDNGDNGIGIVGLQGPGENLVSGNTLLNNGRFGIEIKNPNGSGNATGAGRIVVENNNVSRTASIIDQRDIVGIAAFRRGVLAGNVDVPTGAVIRNNTVSGYVQASTSDGFGIVVEGINHSVTGNTVSGCDVGIQMQAGHLPYPGDGDQSNLADQYFGRGNSPIACGVTISGNNFATNGTDTRYIGATAGSGFVLNTTTGETFCSIQSAIDDAQTLNGHALQVSAGTYTENLTINKSVEIRGANYGISAGYTAGTRGAESIILGQATVSAAGVKFDGLEFDSPVASTTTLVKPTITGLTILFQNNVFDMKNQKSAAIYNDGMSSTSFTILNNKFKNQFYSGSYSSRVIYAKNTYCNITGNDFSAVELGVYLVGNSTDLTTVEGNRFNVTSAAVLVGERQNIKIINNDFVSGGAIYCDKTSNLTIENNNFGAGVSYAGWFSSTCGSGIIMNNNSILSAYISGSNAGKTLFNFSMNIIDASCNWWGTTVPCVLIPKISGNVNFVPYLTNGTDNSGATGFQPVPGSCNGNEGVVKNLNTNKYYCSIQAAIDDAPTVNGHTIQASTGTYNESPNVNKELTIQAGSTPVVNGMFTILANNVTIDGFTIHNPVGNYAISSTGWSGLTVKNNKISNIGTTALSGATHAIVVVMSSTADITDVEILDNEIFNIRGGRDISLTGAAAKANNGSGNAIGIGWSNANFNITDLVIKGNKIYDVEGYFGADFANGGKGAYGIIINVGANSANAGKAINAQILYNEIFNLEGWWSHGIGLEGETPNALVLHNKIYDLDEHKSPTAPDAVGVMVEQNDAASSIKINFNHFTDMIFGIFNATSTPIIDGQYNWWGDCKGPGYFSMTSPIICSTGDLTSTGVLANCSVDYTPWLGSPAIGGPALWLTPTMVMGNPSIALWPGVTCNGLSATMDPPNANKQPSYVNNGVRFVSDYGATKYGYSDMMQVQYDASVTSDVKDKWNPSNQKKDLFVTFQTGGTTGDVTNSEHVAYYRDGRQMICEFGGPLSGYNIYIADGKIVFGMWNRFEAKYTIYDPPSTSTSIYPIQNGKTYMAHLEYDGSGFKVRISDGVTTAASSSTIPFKGLSYDGSDPAATPITGDNSGIAGATRTRYHDYSTGETYSDEFDGIIGDVIVYNDKLGTTETQEVYSYLATRYGLAAWAYPKRSDDDWKVYQQYDFTGDNAVSTAYPNPFTATTSFGVNLTSDMNVTIELIDATGSSVQSIYRGQLNKGIHDFTINGESLPNGMYFYRVQGDGFSLMGKAVLNK